MKPTRTWFPLTGNAASPPAVAGVPRRAGAVAKGKNVIIDPLAGPKLALAGRVVTMNDAFSIRPDGIVYISEGGIVAVQDRAQPAPPDFAGAPVIETGATLFPTSRTFSPFSSLNSRTRSPAATNVAPG